MTLETLIRKKITENGPISIAEYMELCLAHPEHGYYMRADPLGTAGDFITAPEISQVFGELIGLWLSEQWRLMEKPSCILAELGPGRGTLMADILRATKRIGGFHDAVSLHLVETSPVLKQKQWQALAGKHPRIEWHASVDDLPQKPLLLVANEFFDALPIRQFVYEDGWKERMVGVEAEKFYFLWQSRDQSSFPPPLWGEARRIRRGERGSLHMERPFFLDRSNPSPGLPKNLPSASSRQTALPHKGGGEAIEHCEPAIHIAHRIGAQIKTHGGVALIVDYGYSGGSRADTLQAVKDHLYHEILQTPGEADLTAHVDFDALAKAASEEGAIAHGPTPQGAFLGRLGAIMRAMRLCEGTPPEQQAVVMGGISRLLSPDQMGDLFKALCLTHPDHPKPEGF